MGEKRRQTKRKLTANQQEWEYQIKNLKRRIRALEKYAYVDFDIPERPERVTKKDIARIKGIGRKQLLEYAYDVDPFTNERLPYVPPKPKRRSRKAKSSEELEPLPYPSSSEPVSVTDVVLTQVEWLISDFAGNIKRPELVERTRVELATVLTERIEAEGRDVIAAKLEKAVAATDFVMVALMASNSEEAHVNVSKFAHLLYGRPMTGPELKHLMNVDEEFESFEEPT